MPRLLLAIAFCLSSTLHSGTSAAADIDAQVFQDINEYGQARVIISIDPPSMVPQPATVEEAVTSIGKLISDGDRLALRRIGTLPVFAGLLGPESAENLSDVVGVSVKLSEPVPLAVSNVREALGLPISPSETTDPSNTDLSGDSPLLGVPGESRYAVVIIDDGFDTNHPFISGSVLREACFSLTQSLKYKVRSLCPNGFELQTTEGAASYCPAKVKDCAHATHVAGLITGTKGLSGETEIFGIAPSTPIIVINVYTLFEDSVQCWVLARSQAPCVLSYTDHQLEAFEYIRLLAREHRIAAVNVSFGQMLPPEADCENYILAPIIRELLEIGILTVAAVGNDGTDRLRAPACIDAAIAVGATDNEGNLAKVFPPPYDGGTNLSPKIDMVAPGVDLLSSIPGGSYSAMTGTSMAAPLVTAAIAQVRQILGPTEGPPMGNKAIAETVMDILRRNAIQVSDSSNDQSYRNLRLANVTADAQQIAVAAAGLAHVSVPAGEATKKPSPVFPAPGGDEVILFGNRPYSSDDIAQFQQWILSNTGDSEARVIQKANRSRLVIETNRPIDKSALEWFSKELGAGGTAYDRAFVGVI